MTVRVLIVARPQTARRKIARIRTRAAVVHFVAAAMPHRKVDFAVANACQFRRQFCQTSRRALLEKSTERPAQASRLHLKQQLVVKRNQPRVHGTNADGK